MTKQDTVARAIRYIYRRAGLNEPDIVWLNNPQEVFERAIPDSFERLPTPTLRWRWRNRIRSWAESAIRERWDWNLDPPQQVRNREPREASPRELGMERLTNVVSDIAERALAAEQIERVETTLTEAGLEIDGNARSGARRTAQRRLEDHWVVNWSPLLPGARLLHESTVAMLPGVVYACLPPGFGPLTDERGRPHSTDGPVVRYDDGWELYAIEGMPVPSEWITDPESITPAAIRRQRNQELRRIMMQQYGLERFMQADGGRVIDEDVDELGLPRRLWFTRNGRAAEAIVALEVQNSSLEPDGSRRTFYLRVPPHLQRVVQAAAWTFSLEENEYKPRFQS